MEKYTYKVVELDPIKYHREEDLLNKMGRKGWVLSAVRDPPMNGRPKYYFRREGSK